MLSRRSLPAARLKDMEQLTTADPSDERAVAEAIPDWRGWGWVVGFAVFLLPVAAVAWFMAWFGGHEYMGMYVAAGAIFCVPMALLCLGRTFIGAASRCLAGLFVAAAAGYWLMELSAFMHEPGWTF